MDDTPSSSMIHISYTEYNDSEEVPLRYSSAAMVETYPITIEMPKHIIKDLQDQTSVAIGNDKLNELLNYSAEYFLTNDNIICSILFYLTPSIFKSINWQDNKYKSQLSIDKSPTLSSKFSNDLFNTAEPSFAISHFVNAFSAFWALHSIVQTDDALLTEIFLMSLVALTWRKYPSPQCFLTHKDISAQNTVNYDELNLMRLVTTAFKVNNSLRLPPEPPPSFRPVPMSRSNGEIEQCEDFSLHVHYYSSFTDYSIFKVEISLSFRCAFPQVTLKTQKSWHNNHYHPYMSQLLLIVKSNPTSQVNELVKTNGTTPEEFTQYWYGTGQAGRFNEFLYCSLDNSLTDNILLRSLIHKTYILLPCIPAASTQTCQATTIQAGHKIIATMTSDFLTKLMTLGIGQNKQKGFSIFSQLFTYLLRQCKWCTLLTPSAFKTQETTKYDLALCKSNSTHYIVTTFKVKFISISHSNEEIEQHKDFPLHSHCYLPFADYFMFRVVVSLAFHHAFLQFIPRAQKTSMNQDSYKSLIKNTTPMITEVPDSQMLHRYLLSVLTAHQVFLNIVIIYHFAHEWHAFITSLVYTVQEGLRTDTRQVKSHMTQELPIKNTVSINDCNLELITWQQGLLDVCLFKDARHHMLGMHLYVETTTNHSSQPCNICTLNDVDRFHGSGNSPYLIQILIICIVLLTYSPRWQGKSDIWLFEDPWHHTSQHSMITWHETLVGAHSVLSRACEFQVYLYAEFYFYVLLYKSLLCLEMTRASFKVSMNCYPAFAWNFLFFFLFTIIFSFSFISTSTGNDEGII